MPFIEDFLKYINLIEVILEGYRSLFFYKLFLQ